MGRFFSRPRRYFSVHPADRPELLTHAVRCEFLAGVRLAFLSDIHANRRFPDDRLEGLFARVDALSPDAVLIGGDLAEDEASLRRLLRALEIVRPRLGVFCCMGNNDSELPGFSSIAGERMRVLVNESAALNLSGGRLVVGGVDDRKHGHPSARGLFPAGEGAFRVLLSHYPVAPDYAGTPKADLQFSGHTHGGQFNVLGVTPFSALFECRSHRWISGECAIDGVRTIVSNGIGASRLPLRVGVPPQLHLVVLCE